ncbi:MAG: LysR family transcriptional regulator substrate-binding protein [Rhodospirillales bacterium]|nr:LysR family transcriptional regulator substrate-binding protein [Rhodospirillales bacterium]
MPPKPDNAHPTPIAIAPEALAPAEGGVTPAVLGAMPLILYEPAGTTRTLIDAWFRAGGVEPQPRMQLDSIETIKVLVAGGLGASVMPGMALPGPVPQACIRPLDPPLARSLALVVRPEKRRDRGLRLLEAALAGRLSRRRRPGRGPGAGVSG